MTKTIDHIEIRGARVHNLKNIDVDVPLGQMVGIAGVSGSGKSSLALGVLYSEGSRRYLEALSTYTRRRMSQPGKAAVDDIRFVPAALALHQRPAIPGVRSTFGTMSELLNSMRLLFSRVGSHACPHCGASVPPSLNVAAELPLACPSCKESFFGPSAEDLAFNSAGACSVCSGTGIARTVNRLSLVPDESKSIDEGAVVVWGSLMWDLMKQVCGAMGVRTNVPFSDLTPVERDIVFNGPAEKRHILYKAKKGDNFAELDFTYYNAIRTVENALAKAKDEKGLARVAKYLTEGPCPHCHGTRLSDKALETTIAGRNLAQATQMTLSEATEWVSRIPSELPDDMRPIAKSICESLLSSAKRLLDLGLGYLSLDRAGNTLSTGERQRIQLARSVRNQTTGVLYVLDEPSIGLHPANVDGLLGVIRDLIDEGNSVVVVDHDTRVLAAADHIIEMGPSAGSGGGTVIYQGSVAEAAKSPTSLIGPYLSKHRSLRRHSKTEEKNLFDLGRIHLESRGLHTVKPFSVDIPKGRLVVVIGMSGSGKTTLVLETLVPALTKLENDEPLPSHVSSIDPCGIRKAKLIDASPIGINVRSTVATYSGVLDELRKAFARTDAATKQGLKMGDFTYNTGKLRCPTCEGTGQITLDVQFLPDVEVICPNCHGSRYTKEASEFRLEENGLSLPETLSLSIDEALPHLKHLKKTHKKLETLHDLGLGYLTLGEATPALSGGEAQRLKLASEVGKGQEDTLFVFDEPTIGLHPHDVETLLDVFDKLVDKGATVVVIEHDLDFIANADYVIDMGPKGGSEGGRIVAYGTPSDISQNPESITGRYLTV